MRLPHTKHSLRTFRVKHDGSVMEGDPLVLHNTLHSHAIPDGEAALLRLEVPDKTGFDCMAQRLHLIRIGSQSLTLEAFQQSILPSHFASGISSRALVSRAPRSASSTPVDLGGLLQRIPWIVPSRTVVPNTKTPKAPSPS